MGSKQERNILSNNLEFIADWLVNNQNSHLCCPEFPVTVVWEVRIVPKYTKAALFCEQLYNFTIDWGQNVLLPRNYACDH